MFCLQDAQTGPVRDFMQTGVMAERFLQIIHHKIFNKKVFPAESNKKNKKLQNRQNDTDSDNIFSETEKKGRAFDMPITPDASLALPEQKRWMETHENEG